MQDHFTKCKGKQPVKQSRFGRMKNSAKSLLKKIKAPPSNVCQTCGAMFSTQDDLNLHKNEHEAHICANCGAEFQKVEELNEHFMAVHFLGED